MYLHFDGTIRNRHILIQRSIQFSSLFCPNLPLCPGLDQTPPQKSGQDNITESHLSFFSAPNVGVVDADRRRGQRGQCGFFVIKCICIFNIFFHKNIL